MASFLMPPMGDGKSAVKIVGEFNDDGNSAVMVDTKGATAKCRRGRFSSGRYDGVLPSRCSAYWFNFSMIFRLAASMEHLIDEPVQPSNSPIFV